MSQQATLDVPDLDCADGSDEPPMRMALAIKHCLDNLAADARQFRMTELAHFIGLAAMVAEDSARQLAAKSQDLDPLLDGKPAGHC
ncbi:hypothetical protein [Oleisolibacter albus]|uniref:hypothetical protein n=1 Tax=Oleisolibacter albus TaxID=2171757 RepID=UPI0012D7E173|nr:hypothetical protein [Oleisolibacter albus]